MVDLVRRNPLTRFNLDEKQTFLSKLILNDYRMASAVIDNTATKPNTEDIVNLVVEGLDTVQKCGGINFIIYCITEDLERTKLVGNLWRQNSTEIRVVGIYCKHVGREYLLKTFADSLEKILQKNLEMEIFTEKMTDRGQLMQNLRNIENSFQMIFDQVMESELPWQLRYILYHVHLLAVKKFNHMEPFRVSGEFFFLAIFVSSSNSA